MDGDRVDWGLNPTYWDPVVPVPPEAPVVAPKAGPITQFQGALEAGLELYDAAQEPAALARDIAVKGVFAGLRRLFYRR